MRALPALAAFAAFLTAGLPATGHLAAAEAIVAYTIVDRTAIPRSLTGGPGNAAAGRVLFADEARAGCAGCHGVPGESAALPDTPDLGDVGARLAPGEIRLWIVAPEAIEPLTRMPAYYLAGQRAGAEDPLHGGPRLTAVQIEDLVAYLSGLKGSP